MLGVNDLNGCTDPNTNGSEVEGGLFTEESVTRYPLIVIKCNSFRETIAGEGLPVGPDLQGPFLRTCLNGKFSSLNRKFVREDQEGRVPRSPLLLHQEGGGGWETGPCPPQIYARIQKFVKTQHTI